jgi:hypothetical protein
MSIGILQQHPVIRLVEDHLQRYPEMQIQDVYKMLYQGEFGVRHILDNPETAYGFLLRELEQIPGDASETLWEEISPDRTMIRIQLTAFLGRHLNPDDLWQAMIMTAESVIGDMARFKANWDIFRQGTEDGILPFSLNKILDFWHDMQHRSFPPVHHSDKYIASYHPAYRVIKMDYVSIVTKY